MQVIKDGKKTIYKCGKRYEKVTVKKKESDFSDSKATKEVDNGSKK